MRSVTKLDALEQVKKLGAAYKLPSDPSATAELWTEVLSDVSVQEMREAVSAYIRDAGRYFPTPGEIRERALTARRSRSGTPTDLRARYLAWEQHHEGPCPVCSAVLQAIRGERPDGTVFERYGVIHDYHTHQYQRVPHVGLPYRLERRGEEAA